MDYPVISHSNPLVLASASPRRKALLRQVGLPFTAIPSRIDEKTVSGNPAEIARVLAYEKAFSVAHSGVAAWILGADTVVVVDHFLLGKPKDKADAHRMLTSLSGRAHRVITGISLLNPAGKQVCSQAVSTLVRMKHLEPMEIDAYLTSGESFGKAGGYAIQGIGAFMVTSITGSYSNVVGLPLCVVIEALLEAGALAAFP
jgi:septum formation protein